MSPNVHSYWTNDDEVSVTFPIWNLSGQLVGYQRYRPLADKTRKNDPREGRYFTRIGRDRVGVWGMESWKFSETLFVTEGVFDACRLTSIGYSAIAILSYQVNPTTYSWLRMVRGYRPVVAVCDGDTSGHKMRNYGHTYHTCPTGSDLGNASPEYVQEVARKYT
jgi:hypothetical protein